MPIVQYECSINSNKNESSLLGLSKGGAQIRKCRNAYKELLELLIKLASLQSSFTQLDMALNVTNRRVNALENVVVPKLENTTHYILSELDESEREDLYRLKKVVAKKKIEAAILDTQRREREDNEALQVSQFDTTGTILENDEPKSMLDEYDDDQNDLVIDQL